MPTVPVNADSVSWKPASPKNFLSANVTGQAVKANADGTLTVAAGVVGGSARGLVLENNSAFPDNAIDIAVAEVLLREPSGFVYLAQNVAVTASLIAPVGTPGALDAGFEAASTWYYVWLIFDGTTVAGLFSASPTAPVMPSGYTFKARVGAVYNNAGSNLIRVMQLDKVVSIEEVVVFTLFGSNTNWNVLTDASLAAFRTAVPPIARSCMGNGGAVTNAIGGLALAPCNKDGTVNATNPMGVFYAFALTYQATPFDLWTLANNYSVFVRGGANYNIQYKTFVAVARQRLTVTGFTL